MIQPGLHYTAHAVVTPEQLANAMGSGDLPVLATPAMIALMEHAAMLAVAQDLPQGSTTVGVSMECNHLHASPLGMKFSATAELEAIEGRKLHFRVTARDASGIIGEGSHCRFIVDAQRFMAKIQ